MWFDDHAWPANSILIDLYQSDTGYIYASFPNVGHLVVLDPTKPVGKKEIRDIDLRALTGDTEVYNQSLAISGDTVFVGDDDGGAGVIQMSLDGSSARTHPLTEDARPYVPTNQLPLYEQATAQSLTVSPDGASLYVGVHLQIMGTDGRGLFMAYAIGSDGSLTLTYAMLCETQELIQTIIVTPQHVYAPSFILTSMDVEHNVYVFDNTAGTVALSGCIELDNTVQGARLSPDGLVYITTLSETGTNGGFAVLRPTIGSIGEVAYKVNNADERLVGLAFSADGRLIYASNFGGGEDSPDPLITVYALSSALESLEPPIISVPDPNTPPASTLPATGEAGGVLALAAAVILLLSGVLVLLGRRLYMRDARPWSANRQNRQNTSERHAAKRNAGG
jgi:LPXTG-motif cell wall-anchored protein